MTLKYLKINNQIIKKINNDTVKTFNSQEIVVPRTGSTGSSVEFSATDGPYTVYDGQNSSGTLLGTIQPGTSQTFTVTSGYAYCAAGDGYDYNGEYDAFTGGVAISSTPSTWEVVLSVTGDGTARVDMRVI